MLRQIPRVAQFQARGSLLVNRTKTYRLRPCCSVKNKKSSHDDYTKGQLYLLAVSGLWGSYNPTLRLIYSSTDSIDPIAIAAIRGVLQVALLGTVVLIINYLNSNKYDNSSSSIDDKQQPISSSLPSSSSPSTTTTGLLPLPLQASLEIGLYNTVGTIAQTFALSNTSATRGAFLIQASIIFTPLLATFFGPPPSRAAWIACCTALVAAILVTQDSMGITTDTITSTTATNSLHPLLTIDSATTLLGDVQTLIAALFYSLATVRIPKYASKMSPLTLAFGKSAFLAATAVGTALIEAVNRNNTNTNINNISTYNEAGTATINHIAQGLTQLWPDWAAGSGGGGDSMTIWLLLIWSAFGPGSLAAFLMVKGQSMVSATDAQIAFATVPLWSALLALGMVQESVGWLTWLGGALMIGAGVYAALEGRKAAAAAAPEQ